ncbi:MAG: DUF1214 domain-containing protein [Bacteroidia bacterium]|nr:DUF1214 domain-containing protein [Bacteroidia bacterium]
MKLLLKVLGIALLGLVAGFLFSFFRIQSGSGIDEVFQKNGPWRFAPKMDLAENQYQRALIARVGLFALLESEVLYYALTEDENGDPLSSDHIYELTGESFDARYWSFTLYGEDDFLIPNEEKRFTLNEVNMVFEDSLKNSYQFYLSQEAYGKNWIPSGDAVEMSLLLRLYNPSPDIYERAGEISLPQIKKIR